MASPSSRHPERLPISEVGFAVTKRKRVESREKRKASLTMMSMQKGIDIPNTQPKEMIEGILPSINHSLDGNEAFAKLC